MELNDRILQVFLLEDMPTDQELIKRQILKVIPNAVFTLVKERKEFEEKVKWNTPDLIISDYNLKLGFTGLDALFFFREHNPGIPFIFVTGTLSSEEKVAEAILRGATDYVLKDNLSVLPEKINKAMLRYEIQRAEEKKILHLKKQQMLYLQQLGEILEKAPEFEQKSKMKELLGQLAV